MSTDNGPTRPRSAAWTRRDTIRAAGAAGAAVAGAGALAACGSGSDGGGTSTDGGGSGTITTADVPVGGGTIDDGLKVVVTQPTQGDYKAFSAVCTHAGCLVGSVQDGNIVCPCHGSEFAISDGSVVRGPATQPLAEKQVTVSGTDITVS